MSKTHHAYCFIAASIISTISTWAFNNHIGYHVSLLYLGLGLGILLGDKLK